MKIRVLTALVALAIAIPLVYFGGIYLTIIMAILSIIAMAEIYMMKKRVLVSVDFILAALSAVSLTVFDQLADGPLSSILTFNGFITRVNYC
ncbi:phosphatidate cytidylyltransferase [Holzapfeliella floricola]|uniref:phosphatidate cytidylyltransferase n=1 Tax=Holzapfeliella floricola TaxID=679249 RepID=UPI0034E26770